MHKSWNFNKMVSLKSSPFRCSRVRLREAPRVVQAEYRLWRTEGGLVPCLTRRGDGGLRFWSSLAEESGGFGLFKGGSRLEVMGGVVRLCRKPRRLLLVLFLSGLTRAQLSGCCCQRQLCIGLSGCGRRTVAAPLLMSLNSPPMEPLRCRRAGCGNGPDWWCRGPPSEVEGRRKDGRKRRRRTKRRCE